MEQRDHLRKLTLLYGTTNPAKLEAMKNRLSDLPFLEIEGLKEGMSGVTIQPGDSQRTGKLPQMKETGNSVLENAVQKARQYYELLHRPVFSCDTGIYLEGVPGELQPGIHVRQREGKYLTDEELLGFYQDLAVRYDPLTAVYQNGICLILDEEHIYASADASLKSKPFRIVDKPHPIRKEGFPLDSLSVDPETGAYFYDLAKDSLDKIAVEDGFLQFFKDVFTGRTDWKKWI